MKQKGKVPYFLIVFYFIFLLVINYNFQDRIELSEGKGYDGVYYYQITEQITKGEPISTAEPFCYRIGTPYLSTLLPFNIFNNFLIINQIATLLSCLLLFYWFQFFVKSNKTRLLLVLFLMSSWIFYIRFTQFYPMHCDSVAFLFIIGLLILTQSLKNKYSHLKLSLFIFSLFVAVFFREFLIIFSLNLLFLNNPLDKRHIFFINFSKIKPLFKLFTLAFLTTLLGIYI